MNNTTIKEIERRVNYSVEDGIACGPVSIAAVDAEIVVCDNGERIYLHGQWIDEVPDEVLLEATKESVYDVYMKLNCADYEHFDELIAERDRIDADKIEDDSRYESIYEELKKMIAKELSNQGYEDPFNEEDDIYDE